MRYPDLTISGYDSPPFRPISREEDAEAMERIRKSGARILWVGLGAPKQEIWMLEHSPFLPETAMIGVGAAFDFVAGSIPEAPSWVRAAGLEWFHRLINDPRRLWRRYLISNVTFIVFAFIQILCDWFRLYGDYKGHRD
jgi:N-acetylglucosaminyldiphosphoundecaprenol N-acetyl-beta-D-mannosaminyltransferase